MKFYFKYTRTELYSVFCYSGANPNAALVLQNMLIKWKDSETIELKSSDEDKTPDDHGQETDDAQHDGAHDAKNIRLSIIPEYLYYESGASHTS